MRNLSGWKCMAAGTLALVCVSRFAAAPARAADKKAAAAPGAVSAELSSYKQVAGVSGNLTSEGSDTLNNLMTFWAEAYTKMYPNVKPQIQGKGSATAPPALTQGTALLAPMSRKMKAEEEDAFEAKHGYKPTKIDVALDCLAVYVHKDNPVAGLTLQQLDSIFSKTRKAGFADVKTWGQAGLKEAAWADMPMSIYGRNSESGTYAFFKEHVMLKGDFKDTVKEQPGSAAVVGGVAKDRGGIGYSGIGYKTSEVRALPISKTPTSGMKEPTFENALNGSYPLGRTLYIYVNKKPNQPLPPLVGEFLKFVLSKEGQEIVVKDGYGALPPKVVQKNLKILE
jgi:phosphate transport system substrate-binding protein